MFGGPVRAARRWRSLLIAQRAMFGVGVCLASAAVGASLGLAGEAFASSQAAVLAVAGFAVAAVVARELFGMPFPVPHRRWQVPRPWLQRFWLGTLGFGAAMGVGFLTYTSSLIFYFYLIACILTGSVWEGAVIGLFYGFCFATAVFVVSVAWQDVPPPDQTDRALAVGKRARLTATLISPALLVLPFISPVVPSFL